MTYGQAIRWTKTDGGVETIEVSGCQTQEGAIRAVRQFAEQCGWTPPRWWQWWRWGDTRLPDIPRGETRSEVLTHD